MRIGIDGTALTIPFPCGTKNYCRNLIDNLAAIDSKNEYVVFASKNIVLPKSKNFCFVKTPGVLPFFKRQFFLSYYARRANLDIFHYMYPFGDIFWKHPAIVTTVLDVDLAMTYPYLSKHFMNRVVCEFTRYFVFRNTKCFITISDAIKKELTTRLRPNSRKKITTVYLGLNNKFRFLENDKEYKRFYLTIGDFAPRKNIFFVIKAYSLLPEILRIKHPLKIVSSTLLSADRFDSYAKKLNIDVEILVNISDEKLGHFYKRAFAFIFPSLYEGFGLPIIEAMSCGCPVITSNCGATKEISGDCALLVNPKSVGSIYKGMIKMEDSKLRTRLGKKGLQRSAKFSWEKTARETLAVYNKTISKLDD